MDANEIRKMQIAGFYKEVELSTYNQEDEVREKIDNIQGTSRTYSDEIYTILEMHVDLDIEGFEDMSPNGEPTGIAIPYIVTLDEGSGHILSVRRNFEEGAGLAKKQQYFVHYAGARVLWLWFDSHDRWSWSCGYEYFTTIDRRRDSSKPPCWVQGTRCKGS